VPQSHEAFRDHETSIKAGLVYVANAVRRYLATSSFFHSAHADALRGFQAELAHSADYDGIAASMGRFVPLLPVDECHLAVFDDVESALPDTRVLLSYRRGERDEPGEIVRQGSCTDVLASVVRRQGPAAFVVEQLKNFPEDLGFLVLRSDHHDTNIFTALREAVTNGMRGSFLLGRVRKQAEELADANRELLRLRAKEQEYLSAIKGDLQLARQIQSDFLPQNLPELAGWDLAVHFQPAREVSGDFYDVFLLPDNRTGIVVADVCGKGVGAAIFMALVRSLIRALGGQTVSGDPIETVRFLNDYIMRNHHQDGPYMFATVFYGVLDTDSGVLRYVNAGHPAPVVAAEGHVERHLKRTGPAVGVDLDARYEAADDRLALGDVLFAYTDGVTETQNGHGVLMGRQTLYTVLERSLMTPASLIDSVRREILSHREEQSQSDDITMVVLKRI
jgi:serine phosphatase RsbU (regulator of sigma subunit)